ncbi:hypothetical protein [Clostridium sp. JN-1]|uniref:hypothetical protein n=1 Tax=Clostridium sp. JN-1 TaxID=2483110 RepID=UPI000F0B2C40|nr:hypothetical protein [Clostridium sp. JN-1]
MILTDKETLSAIKQLLRQELSPIKSQLNESTQILKALEHNSEVHKTDISNLTHQVAELQGTVKNMSNNIDKNSSDLNETNKSLLEMYGAHEAEIRTLRRKSV